MPSSQGTVQDRICSHLAKRDVQVNPVLIDQIFGLVGEECDHSLIENHFVKLRRPERYLRDFNCRQIARHLQLLAQAHSAKQKAVVDVDACSEPLTFSVIVVGVDRLGVLECVARSLKREHLHVTQMDVVTHQQPASTQDSPEAAYVIELHVLAQNGGKTTVALAEDLGKRINEDYPPSNADTEHWNILPFSHDHDCPGGAWWLEKLAQIPPVEPNGFD